MTAVPTLPPDRVPQDSAEPDGPDPSSGDRSAVDVIGTTPHRDHLAEESRRAAEESPLEWRDDDDVARVSSPWFRGARAHIAVALIAFVVITAYGAIRSWFDRQLDPVGDPGETVEFIVPSGATTAAIGQLLQEAEIVPNSTFFRYYARWKGEENFQAGEYQMQLNSSAQEAIDVLKAGPKPQVFARFQVREGLWISEILPVIASQLENVTVPELEAVLRSGQLPARYRPDGTTSYEGLLFPDTYEVNADATALEVLQKMSDEFSLRTGSLGYGAADNLVNLSPYEVVIVASMIEGETRVEAERPLVASVIYNRLREGWSLGIDATCLYGAGTRDPEVMINSGILSDPENPYACRERLGLPPTPIGAPSESALDAALNPAETDFFYYVLTDPNGSHTFVETEEEFIEAKAVCVELELGCG